jgi:DNA-directed RNA polymerase subunit N (RpoN/RPB10)
MLFPVRCYTCNTVLAHLKTSYDERCKHGSSVREALDELRVTRMCCRRMFMGHVNSLAQNQMQYPNDNVTLDEGGSRMFRRCEQSHVVSCE